MLLSVFIKLGIASAGLTSPFFLFFVFLNLGIVSTGNHSPVIGRYILCVLFLVVYERATSTSSV